MTPRGTYRPLFLDVLGNHDEVSSQTDRIWRPYVHDQGADFLSLDLFLFLRTMLSTITSAMHFLSNSNILVQKMNSCKLKIPFCSLTCRASKIIQTSYQTSVRSHQMAWPGRAGRIYDISFDL